MSKDFDVLDSARELGYSITQSIEYQNLIKAEEDFYNDLELIEIMEELDKIKDIYNSSQGNNNHENQMYLSKIKELEEDLDQNDTMKNLISAKSKYDNLFKNINNLISYITDEQSRVTLKSKSSKKGCSSCSGCCKK